MKEVNSFLKALSKRVEKAPSDPGVYRWIDKEGKVLYVGKAKNLKKRLQSYVSEREAQQGPWKQSLVRHIADFDLTVTRTELEALILETNWIKEHRPKYNVMMKDDKNYVYVRIAMKDLLPNLSIVRKMENDGAKYFGPYLQAWAIRKTLDMLDELYHFRACQKSIDALNKGVAPSELRKSCLEYQIGKCNGLCVGDVTPEQFRERMNEVIRFLRGDRKAVLTLLKDKMAQAAADKKFEKAGELRDTLLYIESLEEEQNVSDTTGANTDAIGIALQGTKAQVVLLRERGGKIIDERSFALGGEADSTTHALEQFIPQYYSTETDFPDTLLIGEDIEGRELISAWLTQLREKKVDVHVPERGKKSRILEMAETNASEKIRQQLAKWEAAARDAEQALKELQALLDLPAPPKRIEGYDISHLGGTETVASMVVMKDGKPANDQYRSFTLRTLKDGEIDDYKAMREVLHRRLKYLTASLSSEEAYWKEKGVVIRKARKADQKIIEEIRMRELSYPTDQDAYKEMIVAEQDNQIVGMARLSKRAPLIAEIRAVWVDKVLRGGRLGHFLVRKVLKMLKKGRAYLGTEQHLEQYYADLGFRHVITPPNILVEAIGKYPVKNLMIMMYDPVKQKADKSLQTRPDLLVIDGGKGQLGIAVEVLNELSITIPVIGLAKQEEEVFVPGESVSRFFPKESQGKYLLMRLRDEAHRFANRHRTTRKKHADVRSALDEIPGIGEKTKEELLKAFGSVDGVVQASDQELLGMLSPAQLTAIRQSLQTSAQ